MPPRKPKASGPPLQQQKLLLPDGSSTRSGKASGAAAAPPRDPGAAPPVRRSIQKTGGNRADARRMRWEDPSGTEPAGTTANLWSFSDGMVRQLFRKNGVLRVDSKLMPDVKFELHETVQALVNDIHAVAFADDPEGPPRLAGDVESRVITSKHVEYVLKWLGLRIRLPPLDDAAERRSRKAGRDAGDAGEENQGEGDQDEGDQDDGDRGEDDQGDGERGDGGVGDAGAGASSLGWARWTRKSTLAKESRAAFDQHAHAQL